MSGYIEIDTGLCKGCAICTFFCPRGLLSISDQLNAAGYQYAIISDSDQCTGCAICALVCAEVAIEVYRG